MFCYRKLAGCKSDADLVKIPEMESVVVGIFDRLEQGWSFSRVADWLNENKVPLGVRCRRKSWDGAMVRRIVFNPILKGTRVWNDKKSLRVNKTGRRRSVKAPVEERIERAVAHLAFVGAERYDALIEKLVARGELYSVPKRRGGNDPRKGRPKKRTRWPGQHVYCGCPNCGKMYVYGGHGKKQHLMCSGAREYSCWNGVTFDAELAARRISNAVFEFVAGLPGFDPALLDVIKQEAELRQVERAKEVKSAERDIDRLAAEENRLVEALEQGEDLDVLVAALKELKSKRRELEFKCKRLRDELPPPIELPSADQLRSDVQQAFQDLAVESDEFADSMRQIIDKIVVFPVRLCDGGDPVLRARFTVDLSPYLPATSQLPSLQASVRREFVVDLFEMPQRAAFREEVVRLH